MVHHSKNIASTCTLFQDEFEPFSRKLRLSTCLKTALKAVKELDLTRQLVKEEKL